MAERDLADSNKQEPIIALRECSAKESETTSFNEGVPGNLAALNIREKDNSEVENEDCKRPVVEDCVQKELSRGPSSPNVFPTSFFEVASKAEKAESIARKAASSCRIIVEATTDAIDVGQKRIFEALERSMAVTERSDIEYYTSVAEVIEAEDNSEVENEDCRRPVVEDFVLEELSRELSSPNVSPTLPVETAAKAEKTASIARKAASSCRIIVEATTDAVDVGQKRISEALEKSLAATERSDIESYALVAEVIEAAVVSTCRRSRLAEAAAEEAEVAEKDAVQAAAILLNPVISNCVIIEAILSAAVAAKNATDKATAALRAEQAALKEMLKCYAETDYGDFSVISDNTNGRSASACSRFCDGKECAAKQFAVVCFIVGIMLMALVIRKPDFKLFWLLLCVALFMIAVPFLAMIYWIKTYLKERKASMEEKNKRVIREINDRLAELDTFFKSQDE